LLAVLVIVGAYLIIGRLGNTANSTIRTVGQTKATTAQGYANAATTVIGGIAGALGSFFGSSGSGSVAGSPDVDYDEGGTIEGELASGASIFG